MVSIATIITSATIIVVPVVLVIVIVVASSKQVGVLPVGFLSLSLKGMMTIVSHLSGCYIRFFGLIVNGFRGSWVLTSRSLFPGSH